MKPEERQKYWEDVHLRDHYRAVWTMLDDPEIRARLVAAVQEIEARRRVLVPGCGSRVLLEPELARIQGVEEVVGTDYPGVVDLCRQRLDDNEMSVSFEPRDSTDLGWSGAFEVAVVVNSVLSESHDENQRIVESIHQALAPGGSLVGYFPTAFCGFEIGCIDPSSGWKELVDVDASTFHEVSMGVSQIFYTPLRLRRLLVQSGFVLERMEVAFLDSPFCLRQARDYYGLPEELFIYELFVRCTKQT
jgi:SAM-dependent methyltransferase